MHVTTSKLTFGHSGCTPKAVHHRIGRIRELTGTGKSVEGSNTTPTKATDTISAKSTPAKSTPAKTPGTGRGRGRTKKVLNVDEPSEELLASPSAGRKRGPPTNATKDVKKKAKVEELDLTVDALTKKTEEFQEEI